MSDEFIEKHLDKILFGAFKEYIGELRRDDKLSLKYEKLLSLKED